MTAGPLRTSCRAWTETFRPLSYQVTFFQSWDSWWKSSEEWLETLNSWISQLGVQLLAKIWIIIVAFLCFPNPAPGKTDRRLKQNPIMSANVVSTKIPHSWCKLTWHPRASTKSCCNLMSLPEQNICSLVASSPKPCQLHDSRLTFHLIRLLSCRPSLLSNSSRITSSLWIWAVLVSAISSTDKCTPANLAVEIRKWSSVRFNWQGLCFGY